MKKALVMLALSLVGLSAMAASPIVVATPSGGETYVKDIEQPIVLTKCRYKLVTVELSRNGGLSFEPIGVINNKDKNKSKRGKLLWTVGGESSANCILKFTAVYGSKKKPKTMVGYSASFAIVGDNIVNGGPKGDPGLDASASQVAALLMGNPDFMSALKGEKGDQGVPGLAGAQGEQGVQGVAGKDADINEIINLLVSDSAFYLTLVNNLSMDQTFLDNMVFMLVNDPTFVTKVVNELKNDPDFLAAIKGDKGDQGIQGVQGVQGLPGADGEDADPAEIVEILKHDIEFINAAKGDKGDQGIQGLPGADGEDADPAEIVELLKTDVEFLAATKGDKGDQGIQGIQGPPGSQGPVGPNGAPTVSYINYASTSSAVLTSSKHDGTLVISDPNIRGTNHPKGPSVIFFTFLTVDAAGVGGVVSVSGAGLKDGEITAILTTQNYAIKATDTVSYQIINNQ